MQEMQVMKFKDKLADPTCKLCLELCVIPSATATQAIASTGIDGLIIDQEHAATNPETLHAMITATQGTDCAPLVRVVDHNPANVKLALDLGAEGIVFPLIRTPEEAAHCVSTMRYPPTGIRGWGAFVAHSRWGVSVPDYLPRFGDKTVCILLIETPEAVENIDAIFATEGVDMAIIAFFDLSTTLGVSGQFQHPKVLAAVEKIEKAAGRANMPLGGPFATSKPEIDALFARGYRSVGGVDLLQLKGIVQRLVDDVRSGPLS
jgi:4-hydroxy-2-oxoheptanedioate aldolase